MRKANNHICRRNHGRQPENHTLEDRQADLQRGGGIAGCRRSKELLKAGKAG